jgi:hypothetical protein
MKLRKGINQLGDIVLSGSFTKPLAQNPPQAYTAAAKPAGLPAGAFRVGPTLLCLHDPLEVIADDPNAVADVQTKVLRPVRWRARQF